jgi:hypothetical protein
MVFLQPLFVLVLYALVRSGDTAIASGRGGDYLRAICYGVVALLALIAAIMLLGIH